MKNEKSRREKVENGANGENLRTRKAKRKNPETISLIKIPFNYNKEIKRDTGNCWWESW